MKTRAITVHSFTTSVGTLRTAVIGDNLALVGLPNVSHGEFTAQIRSAFGSPAITTDGAINRDVEHQLREYLDGRLRRFTLPLALDGTAFEKKVLRRVAAIPYGRTMTYGQVAAAVGRPGAARAVGGVMARNRLPLVVPCHRVVAVRGLGGYAGGLKLKEKLLRLEGAM